MKFKTSHWPLIFKGHILPTHWYIESICPHVVQAGVVAEVKESYSLVLSRGQIVIVGLVWGSRAKG